MLWLPYIYYFLIVSVQHQGPDYYTVGVRSISHYAYTCSSCYDYLISHVFIVLVQHPGPGRVAQSVTCLATDACLTADPGVASSIPVRSHTFVEIDHEMISSVILFPSADSFKKDCCQLQANVCARITG